MKRLFAILFVAGLALPSAGCLVRTHDHHHSRSSVRRSPGCRPSHYWDGHKCKHKGKGHGARKHDH